VRRTEITVATTAALVVLILTALIGLRHAHNQRKYYIHAVERGLRKALSIASESPNSTKEYYRSERICHRLRASFQSKEPTIFPSDIDEERLFVPTKPVPLDSLEVVCAVEFGGTTIAIRADGVILHDALSVRDLIQSGRLVSCRILDR
jgi:hypothetical protein